MISNADDRFWELLDKKKCCLTNDPPWYDGDVAWSATKLAKSLFVQVKSQEFESFNSISIISFVSGLKLACYINGI